MYDEDYDWDENQIGVLLDNKGYYLKRVYLKPEPYGFARAIREEREQ